MKASQVKRNPRLLIGFFLFLLSGTFFGKVLISIVYPDSNKKHTVNPNKPSSSETTSVELLNFSHPGGSYSFNFPSNWNLLYLTPEENVLMVAPQEQIDAISQKEEGFGNNPDLVITISQTPTKPTVRSDSFWDIISKETIIIDGRTGTKHTIEIKRDNSGFTKGNQIIDIVIPHQKTYFNIQLLDQNHQDTFNKILESFKLMEFIEALPADATQSALQTGTPSPTPSIRPSESPQVSVSASPL